MPIARQPFASAPASALAETIAIAFTVSCEVATRETPTYQRAGDRPADSRASLGGPNPDQLRRGGKRQDSVAFTTV
ncbi:MAG: hypothetical protein LBJ08_00790 [Bifidobacteriaceae bacterium]|jgi:hypothetical protein|nr:hypothetical protein [Bifidobacteriaceae bacterium]